MMRAGVLMLAAVTASGRGAIGVYGGWGAFRDADPPRCYAIARPVVAGAAGGFASIGVRRGRGGPALFVHASRPLGTATATLSIGERRFVLAARGRDAIAADAAADRAVVAAMRSSRSMSMDAVDASGHPFADTYALAGAATAIDAATLACAAAP